MHHPIFSYSKNLSIYIAVCLGIILIHVGVGHGFYNLPLKVAVADALVFDMLMAFIALSIWYPIYYTNTNKSLLNILFQHILAAAFLLAIWLMLALQIVKWVVSADMYAMVYQQSNIIQRIVVGSLFIATYFLVFLAMKYYGDVQEKAHQHEAMLRQLREAELKALKAQINPHFLFNGLNSISALTVTDAEAARDMIHKLSDFMRYALKKNEQTLLLFSDELDNMKRYLDIEKIRFGDRLQCEFTISDATTKMQIPVLLLQPLVENAIKHGVYESIETVTIAISSEVKDGKLQIVIQNNFDPDGTPQKGEGVGLRNISNRIRVLYGDEASFETHRTENTFRISLVIPQHINKTL